MNRAARLQSARHWLPTYRGKDLIRGYARWFGVNQWTAVLELRMLGVPIDGDRAAHVEANRDQPRRPREKPAPPEFEWDDDGLPW